MRLLESGLLAIVVISLTTFVVYGWDKRQAIRQSRRVPEKTLHLLSALGGWPGALMAQQVFRHKNRKPSFQAVFWLIGIVEAGLLIAWLAS